MTILLISSLTLNVLLAGALVWKDRRNEICKRDMDEAFERGKQMAEDAIRKQKLERHVFFTEEDE